MIVGRPYPTTFPWGGTPGTGATCTQAVFGRGPFPFDNDCNKDELHSGPLSVDDLTGPGGDVSLGLGVAGLMGSVSEIMLDAFASFSSNCWAGAPLSSPGCFAAEGTSNSVRGGNWGDPALSVFSARRLAIGVAAESPEVGFRCERSGT